MGDHGRSCRGCRYAGRGSLGGGALFIVVRCRHVARGPLILGTNAHRNLVVIPADVDGVIIDTVGITAFLLNPWPSPRFLGPILVRGGRCPRLLVSCCCGLGARYAGDGLLSAVRCITGLVWLCLTAAAVWSKESNRP